MGFEGRPGILCRVLAGRQDRNRHSSMGVSHLTRAGGRASSRSDRESCRFSGAPGLRVAAHAACALQLVPLVHLAVQTIGEFGQFVQVANLANVHWMCIQPLDRCSMSLNSPPMFNHRWGMYITRGPMYTYRSPPNVQVDLGDGCFQVDA